MRLRQLTFTMLCAWAMSLGVAERASAESVVGVAYPSEGKASQVVVNLPADHEVGFAGRVPSGSVIKTPADRSVLVLLMPGYVVGIDKNSEVLLKTIDQTPLGSTNATRTMVLELRSGRMAGLSERYYPRRTTFKTLTSNGTLSKQSEGMFVISTNRTCTWGVECAGTSAWACRLAKEGTPFSLLHTSQFFRCCPDVPDLLGDMADNPQALADRAFGVAMLVRAVSIGILDASAFPTFAADLAGQPMDLRDRLINPGNGGGLILNLANSPHLVPPVLGPEPPVVVPDVMSPHYPVTASSNQTRSE